MNQPLDSLSKDRFNTIGELLLQWYDRHGRDFPWRSGTRDPYLHLVSEYMLQQTGTAHVVNRLPLFLSRFPSIQHLAEAKSEEVVAEWQGLGYNRRALNLHRAAQMIVEQFSCEIPRTIEELRSLPGIGLYTASAIVAFAYGAVVPVVDINIQRVLSRLWKPMSDTHAMLTSNAILMFDDSIMPQHRSGDWHQALMDLGATVCTKSRPKCTSCPLMAHCQSASLLNAVGVKKQPTERHYFGAPRRIWRGRVLKIVADGGNMRALGIAETLEQRWNVDDLEFESFVRGILRALVAEGFIVRKGLVYQLGSQ